MPLTNLEITVQVGLRPRQPRRFLDVLPQLPDLDSVDRWLLGVKFEPWPVRVAQLGDADDGTNTFVARVRGVRSAWQAKRPFQIVDALRSTVLEDFTDGLDDLMSQRWDLQISSSFALELINGTAAGDGFGLSQTAHAPNDLAFGQAAVAIWKALAILESELARTLRGGQGVLHVSPGLLGQSISTYGVTLVGDHYETPAGNIVLSDAGYFAPTPPAGQAARTAGTNDWVYASGPVWWASSEPLFLGPSGSAVDITRQTLDRILAGYGVVVFDPAHVSAVLTTYTAF